ncbi:MAG TPA: vWA domain-containing protein, partial [Planctomycetaceae bacterium]|nr:vWA domain-containing protein [Planctomycetaceae bacterium]
MAFVAGSWFRWLCGVGADEIPAGAEAHWSWTHLPQSWRVFVALFAAIALLYTVWWLYRWEAPTLSPLRRRWLAGLRMAVVTILAVTALGPAISYTQQRVLRPVVVVLRDASQSMATADVPTDSSVRLTRADQVNHWLTDAKTDWLVALRERGQLRVFDFAQSVVPVEATPSTAWPPLSPVGAGTNLHRALSEATSERMLAAIVVFTDGQHTDRATGPEELRQLARRSRAQGVPWLLVGLGDPRPPRNLEVSEVYADAQVWKDDPFELRAVLKSTGFGAVAVPLELIEQQWDAAGDRIVGERVVEAREVEVPDGDSLTVSFSHTPTMAGRFTYTVKAAALAGESTVEDNQPLTPAEVKVLDDQARVLLVAGGPHWEYRFVSRLLEREKSVNLSCWLQTLDPNRAQEGDTAIPHLPRTKEELLHYDVILLLDPDPRDFDDAWMQSLSEFVGEHAGGLLYMAGPTFTGRFFSDARTSRIAPLLP